MQHFLRKAIRIVLLIFNIVFVLLFLFAFLTPYLNPQRWWFSGFLGLFFPWFFLAVLSFFIFWLFFRKKYSLISFIAMIIALPGIRSILPIRFTSGFNMEKQEHNLRLMNWNIRRFTPFDMQKFNPAENINRQYIMDEIRKYQPDVVCLQEFMTSKKKGKQYNSGILRDELGYPYSIFSDDDELRIGVSSGTAIFSRYPIIRSEKLEYPDPIARDAESLIYADILFGTDTIRIYTLHLQSFGFGPKDYDDFGKIKNQQDKDFRASKNLMRKMRQTFYVHALQADFVKKEISKSPYPILLSGDLNDVPHSYAYHTIRGDLNDAFLEKGGGFGKTFTSPTSRLLRVLPTLRIDYIFTDPRFETSQFTRMDRKLSDHAALIADFELAEK